jgi:hypothetical protein
MTKNISHRDKSIPDIPEEMLFIRDGQKKFWIWICFLKFHFPKPGWHGKKLFVCTCMGGLVFQILANFPK